jgi:serine/threonine protein kinase
VGAPNRQPSPALRLPEGVAQEAAVLTRLRDPNVVGYFGVVSLPPAGRGRAPELGIVMELCNGKSLFRHIQKAARKRRAQLASSGTGAAGGSPGGSSSGIEHAEHSSPPLFSGREAAALLLDIAYGLRAVHESGIVHTDLKSANVLLHNHGAFAAAAATTTSVVAKIADFGLAKLAATTSFASAASLHSRRRHAHGGTSAWMSPEQLRGDTRTLSARADVYALGVIAWELATGRVPWADAASGAPAHIAEITTRVGLNGERLAFPAACAADRDPVWGEITAIAALCFAAEPHHRPAAAEIAARLAAVVGCAPKV